jgi:nucleoside-diphosphate-sugar epimerase
MMRVFLLGGEGFVGSAYARLLPRLNVDLCVITRATYQDYVGQRCDVFINANGNSKKFLADRDPKLEFDASVRSVVHSLTDFAFDRYVFLSTGDVYPSQINPDVTREDSVLDPCLMSRYGLHKFTAEMHVRAVCTQMGRPWLVMRMGGFVGPHMKKNAIFDMLHDQPLWLDLDSELQFISTDRAAQVVWSLVEHGVENETINLGSKGVVTLADVYQRLGCKSDVMPEAKRVRFELNTDKLASLSPVP